MKVYLGGTFKGSKWRDHLVSMLNVDYFSPKECWDAEYRSFHNKEKNSCDVKLFTIVPSELGLYGFAEAVESCVKNSLQTVICVLRSYEGKTFSDEDWKSLNDVKELVKPYRVVIYDSLEDVASYLNRMGAFYDECESYL